MCSISGILKGNSSQISEMNKIQHHRAPDDDNFYVDDNFALGMGRLKIIDLNSGNLCPRKEENFILCYNGEIYNYLELKKNLKLKYNFETTSDTEVLMKLWRQYGVKSLNMLNGMFAFAMYDSKKKKIYLCRDIAGEKPLYYYFNGKDFIFSSEAKAIHRIKKLKYKESKFLNSFQHCLNDTLFENLYQVPAGHYVEYDLRKNKITKHEYWTFKKQKINLKTVDEEFEFLLKDSIKLRRRSDVDMGIYLSDGVDSNLISTFHKFDHKFYFDDSKNWKQNFYKHINKIVYHLDFPVGSLSSYPLWKLAKMANKKVKVVLSGEGADEIFGGYVRYLPVARQWELEKEFPSYSSFFKKNYQSFLRSFAKITSREQNKYLFVERKLKKYFEMFDDPISAMGFADFKLILPSLLQMGDRMASSFGIENRCPYLDKRIIEFGFSLPSNFKIKNLEQKIIVRKLLKKRRGHSAILNTEKKGLTIHFNKWFGMKDWDRNLYFNLIQDEWKKNYL